MELRVTEEIIDHFCQLTGDYSSIHVSEEFARRTPFRSRIAQGMILVCMLPISLQSSLTTRAEIRRIQGRFLAPVPPGTRVGLQLDDQREAGGEFDISAKWTDIDSGKLLCRAKIVLSEPQPAMHDIESSGATSFLAAPLTEHALTLNDAAVASVDLSCTLHADLQTSFLRLLGSESKIPSEFALANAVFATAMLSPLVGMLLPGTHATFVGFDMAYTTIPDNAPCTIVAKTLEVDELSSTISVQADLYQNDSKIASGSYQSLVNPAPVAQPHLDEFHKDLSTLQLDDKVAVVVGGSRGIGEAATKMLAALGANVCLIYNRGADDARRIVGESAGSVARIESRQCDIRNSEQVEAVVDNINQCFGRIDIVVNCAAFSYASTPLESLDWNDMMPEIEVSLRGLHDICRAVVPLMKRQGGGKIVNLSSVVVGAPIPGQLRYITAKSAVAGYTRALSRDLGRHNIQVNMVTPAMTETDLVSGIPAEVRRRLSGSMDAGRHLHGYEVARAIAFLCSSWSDGMNGQQIVLNMGQPPY